MSDPKHEESFKVIDRRLFTEEGELRQEALEQERQEREAPARSGKAAAAAGTAAPAGAPPSGSAAASTSAAPPGTAAPGTEETIPPSRSFQMLVDFLARNAAMLLGGYADPRTGQAIVDLEGARDMIDMLDALREKTRRNLAPDDDNLLMEVLGSLKLSYLEMSKAAAQAMQKKAKSRP